MLRGVLESTADGILVVDEKGGLSRMNKRFAQLWDIPKELVQ
ncbi:MAG: PAS domain-containing protein [Planctomycetota bacterium]